MIDINYYLTQFEPAAQPEELTAEERVPQFHMSSLRIIVYLNIILHIMKSRNNSNKTSSLRVLFPKFRLQKIWNLLLNSNLYPTLLNYLPIFILVINEQ